MTGEEAKRYLEHLKRWQFVPDNLADEALDMAIKALEQEPCENEYIKVPKKALKYRTAGMIAYNADWLKAHFDLERAVICGAQEPCEDAISRQEAIDAFERFIHELGIEDKPYNYGEMALSVQNVPPVTPAEKVGRWMMSDDRLYRPICNNCGAHPWKGYIPTVEEATDVFKYCPQCGSRMMQEVEE